MKVSNHWEAGNRIVDCDICGFTYRFLQMRKGIAKGQKGLVVCPECYSPIHPDEIKHILSPKKPLKKVGE